MRKASNLRKWELNAYIKGTTDSGNNSSGEIGARDDRHLLIPFFHCLSHYLPLSSADNCTNDKNQTIKLLRHNFETRFSELEEGKWLSNYGSVGTFSFTEESKGERNKKGKSPQDSHRRQEQKAMDFQDEWQKQQESWRACPSRANHMLLLCGLRK